MKQRSDAIITIRIDTALLQYAEDARQTGLFGETTEDVIVSMVRDSILRHSPNLIEPRDFSKKGAPKRSELKRRK